MDHTEQLARQLPLRRGTQLSTSITMADETRVSLVPPIPSRLEFDIDVPVDPVLRFAMGVFTFGEPGPSTPLEFNLYIDVGSGAERVFAGVAGRGRPNAWIDREVDLSPWQGETARLIFETKQKAANAAAPDDQVLALWGNPVLSSRTGRSDRPNVILISIDTLRSDHLGTYGYSRSTSPNIDRLAADGVLFETVTSTSSWTLPTHMSMLTGLPPSIHGATKTRKLHDTVPYLPVLLAEAGYRVDALVSVPTLSPEYGFDRGFHSYRMYLDPGATKTVDAAIDLLRKGDRQSHFLFLHLIDAHWPYSPPESFRERFGERPPDISNLMQQILDDVPPSGPEQIDHAVSLYDGEIAYVDRELGRFLDVVKAEGLYESSLIVLTADHGEAFYEHGFWKHTQTLYEEMVRVPLIVKWPGDAPTGRVSSLVSQVDVFPTVLEAVGIESDAGWARDLRRHADEAETNRSVVSEVSWTALPNRPAFFKVAFRNEHFKYVATVAGSTLDDFDAQGIREEELYDLRSDAGEASNLVAGIGRGDPLPGEVTSELRSFRRQLEAYMAEARQLQSTRLGEEVVIDELLRERLEALGYIGH